MATRGASGLEQIARLINGASTNTFTWLAIGCGSVAESITHLKLHQEIHANGGSRNAATCFYVYPNQAKWSYTWTFTGSTTLWEMGVFNGGSTSTAGSTLLFRHKLASSRSLANGDTLALTLSASFTA